MPVCLARWPRNWVMAAAKRKDQGRVEAMPPSSLFITEPMAKLLGEIRSSKLSGHVQRSCRKRLLIVLGWREERCQGIGRSVRRVPDIRQAKGGFNRLQQRKVRLKARVVNPTHSIVRNSD